MTNGAAFDDPRRYQVRIKGALDQSWSRWFEGFQIVPQANRETLLLGRVADQAALYGLLVKIYNLGLPLISIVEETEEET